MIAHTIAAAAHGRYLVEAAAGGRPAPLLVGCHGYAEAAEAQLERLRAIEGAREWTLVSVQALHVFYRGRSQDVVAGWMTRQDRELAIADNVRYVQAVVDAVAAEYAVAGAVVFAGFSQGVAMAFRGAAASTRPVAGVIACGGDVPPELDESTLSRIPAALIGRGLRDEWYTAAKAASDLQRLREARVRLAFVEFDDGHEWAPPFAKAAGAFLKQHR